MNVHDNGNHDTNDDNLEQQKKSKQENPPAPPKEKSKRKNSRNHARVSQQTLAKRKNAFIDSLAPFASYYGNEMLNAFADYLCHALQWVIEESMRIVREAQDKRLLRQEFLFSTPASAMVYYCLKS